MPLSPTPTRRDIQDRGYELPRILIPRTPVNKDKKEGRGCSRVSALLASAIADRPLANRWVRAPHRAAVPDRALGEIHLAHHPAVLNAHPKHVRVALLAIATCASNSDPALPF